MDPSLLNTRLALQVDPSLVVVSKGSSRPPMLIGHPKSGRVLGWRSSPDMVAPLA